MTIDHIFYFYTFLTNARMYEQVCNHPFLFGEPKDEFGTYVTENNKRSLVRNMNKIFMNAMLSSPLTLCIFIIYISLVSLPLIYNQN